MKPLIPAIAAAVLLAGCTASGTVSSGPARHEPKPPPALSAAAGARICGDVASWFRAAENSGKPRFSARLEADTARARGSELGLDLSGLDSDLLQENSDGLVNGPPGDEQNIQLVRSDCEGYGVTVPQG